MRESIAVIALHPPLILSALLRVSGECEKAVIVLKTHVSEVKERK